MGKELGTWLTSSPEIISPFVRRVKYFRSLFAYTSFFDVGLALKPACPAKQTLFLVLWPIFRSAPLLRFSPDNSSTHSPRSYVPRLVKVLPGPIRMRQNRPSLSGTFFISASFLVATLASAQTQSQTTPQKPVPKSAGKPATPGELPIASPVSRHYPILIVAHGNDPSWSLRLGMKGPERLDRPGYPPIILDPADITSNEPGMSWTYHAKDDVTGADVSIKLTRETCTDNPAASKFTFAIAVQHAQIGALAGCGQSAPDKFPEFRKKNQPLDPDDEPDPKDKDKSKDKDKTAVLDPITKFQSPTAVAYLDSNGHVIFARSGVRKTVANQSSELAVSHDGKKLLYTRSDSPTGPERSIVLYDSDTGRSRDLVSGNARSAFWSPDDSRVAFLKYDAASKIWQLWTLPIAAPESAALFGPQPVNALHGWVTATTILASDLQNAYWLSDDKPPQSVPLNELYGDMFQVMSSDALRPNPINADLLLVTACYRKAPTLAPTDSVGLNSTFFLYELPSHRRTVLGPADAYARSAEWSRDGLQIFFTRGVPGKAALTTWRLFWDATGLRSYSPGSFLSIGK